MREERCGAAESQQQASPQRNVRVKRDMQIKNTKTDSASSAVSQFATSKQDQPEKATSQSTAKCANTGDETKGNTV